MLIQETQLHVLLRSTRGLDFANTLCNTLQIHPNLLRPSDAQVSRAELAQAMNMILFQDLLTRVPEGKAYVDDTLADGGKILFDHGALRTVAWPCGALPPGEAAFTRFLRPLGFSLNDTYPLPRLKMTGRAYFHEDFPNDIAQFFISELHPNLFSERFQNCVTRVLATSHDPLSAYDVALLEQLRRDKCLSLPAALYLLPKLVSCFERHHTVFSWDDYNILLAESAEMAWISTEGNAFNHATDRVVDVAALADQQRLLKRSIKDQVEISKSGRVRQTALRAVQTKRAFISDAGIVEQSVPGSFYEFISRDTFADENGVTRLDLAFDASNATGIFKMTSAQAEM